MSDDEIVKRISQECGVMVLLQMIGRREKARLFAQHIIRVIATNQHACARWMDKWLPEPKWVKFFAESEARLR